MARVEKTEGREDALNDSWVELHFQQGNPIQQLSQQMTSITSSVSSGTDIPAMSKPHFISGQMEKLLLEAQKESSRSSSRTASIPSSRASPKSPHSPNNEPNTEPIATIQEIPNLNLQASDWIWDWSSRPEAHPPSELSKLRHPVKRHKLSVRNTRVMRSGPFCLEHLPQLLLSHACTFIMGAAVMFIYLKKYCHLTVVATTTLAD